MVEGDIPPMISDTTAFTISLIIMVCYYLYVRVRLHKNPFYSMPALNTMARSAWVENMMDGKPGRDILAVQTLRNSTMAATFFASTAILLVIGVLNLVPRNGDVPTAVFEILYRHATDGDAGTLKLLCLLGTYFWAFFCFSLAVRMYNHVSFLINSANSGYPFITPALVTDLLNRGGYYYSLGMHTYYLSLPVLFWLFGPIYLMVASVGVVVLMYHADYGGLHSENIAPTKLDACGENHVG